MIDMWLLNRIHLGRSVGEVIVNVQFEKGIRDIFVGVFVFRCVSNSKQTHPQKYL